MIEKLLNKLGICIHKWEYLEEPNDKHLPPKRLKCYKCDTVVHKHIDAFKVKPRTYLWCRKHDCKMDLIKNSYKVMIRYGVWLYVCKECGTVSIFLNDFVPIDITDDYNIGKVIDVIGTPFLIIVNNKIYELR